MRNESARGEGVKGREREVVKERKGDKSDRRAVDEGVRVGGATYCRASERLQTRLPPTEGHVINS